MATLDELKKLLLLLRKNGVLHYESGDGLKLDLHADSMKLERPAELGGDDITKTSKDPWSSFPTGELTPEQLQFYSAGGSPEDDPENKSDA